MIKSTYSLIWTVIIIFTSTFTLYGDIRYEADPRGKIEQLTGEGEYLPVKEGAGKWTFKGADQDWVFTRTTKFKDGGEFEVKRERFWIAIRRVDGVWVTRTKYRYKMGSSDSIEVTEKDKSGKFSANCRISENKIILSLIRKKQGLIFKITKAGEFIQVNHLSLSSLKDITILFKRQ